MKYRMRPASPAFSLVEVTLALGVAAVCILAVIALLPVGILSNRDSIAETTAARLSGLLIADLRGTPAASGATSHNSPLYGIGFPQAGSPSATTSLFLNADGSQSAPAAIPSPAFRATVTVTTPSSGRAASTARVRITWPAMADPNPDIPPTNASGSSIIVVGLDRN
jgi:uncharacterized protein (TIGR02598 family)